MIKHFLLSIGGVWRDMPLASRPERGDEDDTAVNAGHESRCAGRGRR